MIQTIKTPMGELLLGSYAGKICLCDWRFRQQRTSIDSRLQKSLNANYQLGSCELIKQASLQLDEYFHTQRSIFSLPLLLQGTDFQISVWQALGKIPYAATISYLQLAKNINKPLAVRAVANANASNALSILIPCHRVINSNGELGGYAGGATAKEKLLKLESSSQH